MLRVFARHPSKGRAQNMLGNAKIRRSIKVLTGSLPPSFGRT
jgi:hypothetical protein